METPSETSSPTSGTSSNQDSSPKRQIKLGVVQSSTPGSRNVVGVSTKKSRWDQAPDEEEDNSTKINQELNVSKCEKEVLCVKDLILKFEDLKESSSEVQSVKSVETPDVVKSVSGGPTRVKLVRTNFMKTPSPTPALSTAVNSEVSDRVDKTKTTDTLSSESCKKEKNLTALKPTVSPVTSSRALQIISSCYDSPTDDSSPEDESPSDPHNKSIADSAYSSLKMINEQKHCCATGTPINSEVMKSGNIIQESPTVSLRDGVDIQVKKDYGQTSSSSSLINKEIKGSMKVSATKIIPELQSVTPGVSHIEDKICHQIESENQDAAEKDNSMDNNNTEIETNDEVDATMEEIFFESEIPSEDLDLLNPIDSFKNDCSVQESTNNDELHDSRALQVNKEILETNDSLLELLEAGNDPTTTQNELDCKKESNPECNLDDTFFADVHKSKEFTDCTVESNKSSIEISSNVHNSSQSSFSETINLNIGSMGDDTNSKCGGNLICEETKVQGDDVISDCHLKDDFLLKSVEIDESIVEGELTPKLEVHKDEREIPGKFPEPSFKDDILKEVIGSTSSLSGKEGKHSDAAKSSEVIDSSSANVSMNIRDHVLITEEIMDQVLDEQKSKNDLQTIGDQKNFEILKMPQECLEEKQLETKGDSQPKSENIIEDAGQSNSLNIKKSVVQKTIKSEDDFQEMLDMGPKELDHSLAIREFEKSSEHLTYHNSKDSLKLVESAENTNAGITTPNIEVEIESSQSIISLDSTLQASLCIDNEQVDFDSVSKKEMELVDDYSEKSEEILKIDAVHESIIENCEESTPEKTTKLFTSTEMKNISDENLELASNLNVVKETEVVQGKTDSAQGDNLNGTATSFIQSNDDREHKQKSGTETAKPGLMRDLKAIEDDLVNEDHTVEIAENTNTRNNDAEQPVVNLKDGKITEIETNMPTSSNMSVSAEHVNLTRSSSLTDSLYTSSTIEDKYTSDKNVIREIPSDSSSDLTEGRNIEIDVIQSVVPDEKDMIDKANYLNAKIDKFKTNNSSGEETINVNTLSNDNIEMDVMESVEVLHNDANAKAEESNSYNICNEQKMHEVGDGLKSKNSGIKNIIDFPETSNTAPLDTDQTDNIESYKNNESGVMVDFEHDLSSIHSESIQAKFGDLSRPINENFLDKFENEENMEEKMKKSDSVKLESTCNDRNKPDIKVPDKIENKVKSTSTEQEQKVGDSSEIDNGVIQKVSEDHERGKFSGEVDSRDKITKNTNNPSKQNIIENKEEEEFKPTYKEADKLNVCIVVNNEDVRLDENVSKKKSNDCVIACIDIKEEFQNDTNFVKSANDHVETFEKINSAEDGQYDNSVCSKPTTQVPIIEVLLEKEKEQENTMETDTVEGKEEIIETMNTVLPEILDSDTKKGIINVHDIEDNDPESSTKLINNLENEKFVESVKVQEISIDPIVSNNQIVGPSLLNTGTQQRSDGDCNNLSREETINIAQDTEKPNIHSSEISCRKTITGLVNKEELKPLMDKTISNRNSNNQSNHSPNLIENTHETSTITDDNTVMLGEQTEQNASECSKFANSVEGLVKVYNIDTNDTIQKQSCSPRLSENDSELRLEENKQESEELGDCTKSRDDLQKQASENSETYGPEEIKQSAESEKLSDQCIYSSSGNDLPQVTADGIPPGEVKYVTVQHESELKAVMLKESISENLSKLIDKHGKPIESLTVVQVPDKAAVKPKEIPPPVRVSARQKQRQAAAAALAAEKAKSTTGLVKKGSSLDKNAEKRLKKSVSPNKELHIKPIEMIKQSPVISPRSSELKLSPKKITKELSQEKLEPITLKLSKEDNPVIVKSLSPKRSSLSPQTKTLGYTLKIGKDSATIVPKDSTLSPKGSDPTSASVSGKTDSANKVGYFVKDTGLSITPIPSENQDQTANRPKITLKLAKAGGSEETQEKSETWKAIQKLGEIDIRPVEGKSSPENLKRKEKSESQGSDKKLKLAGVTVEPSTSGMSKLQGLLTQAPLNHSDDSNDVQFIGFVPPTEKIRQTPSTPQYDIGMLKPEVDPQPILPKKRGRPRKISSPDRDQQYARSSHSLPPGLTAKDILAASLQHQTLQQHLHMQQQIHMQQLQEQQPPEELECTPTMFPVPLFDLSEDTYMDPPQPNVLNPPTIFPDQVQPQTIMRSARGRPIGRSRRSRGANHMRGAERGPRGRPRGSRGMRRMMEEMRSIMYNMDEPITLDNIDSQMGPRFTDQQQASQITEKTIALLRKSIEGKKENQEKKQRRSDGNEDGNRDSDIDAKVREMKEKIEAAYQAELKSPRKISPDKRKSAEKTLPEKQQLSADSKTTLSEVSHPKKERKKQQSEGSDEEKPKRKSVDGKSPSSLKRKLSEEKSEKSGVSPKKFAQERSEESVLDGSKSILDDSQPDNEEMDVDQPTSPGEVKSEEKVELTPPPKPVKPRPKSKAEIKRIKREKDRLRREAKKLAALEALKAAPPPPEEDTRMSASEPNGDGIDGDILKKSRMEVEGETKEFTVDQIAEYQWPLQGGELYMIQEQISTYLGVKSFKRKYPEIKRRPVEMEERTFLCDSGLVSESMCDLGLTAVSSSEVLDIMFQDFQDQYEELRKCMREKQARELINKQKEKKKFEQSLSKSDLKEHAIQSSLGWNQMLNRSREESRKCHLDLQTWTVQYPRGKWHRMTRPTAKLGNYPVALIPGQYCDYYKRYTPQELRYWPVNTVLYGPLQPNERHSHVGSEGSQSESEDSSSSDDSSDSSSDEGTECEDRERGTERGGCKACGGGGKREAAVTCSQCGHNSTTGTVWA